MTDVKPRAGARLAGSRCVAGRGARGCAVGPNYVKPDDTGRAALRRLPPDGLYSRGDGAGSSGRSSATTTLDQLVDEALERQPRPAHRARPPRRGARRSARRRSSTSRRRSPRPAATPRSASRRCRASPGTALDARFYDAGFDAFWELDLFGRVRRKCREPAARRSRAPRPRCATRRSRSRPKSPAPTSSCAVSRSQLAVARRNVEQPARDAAAHAGAPRGRAWHRIRHVARAVAAVQHARHHRTARGRRRALHSPSGSVLTGREPNALDALLASRARAAGAAAAHRGRRPGGPAAPTPRHPRGRASAGRLHARTSGWPIGDLFPQGHLHRQLQLRRDRDQVPSVSPPAAAT